MKKLLVFFKNNDVKMYSIDIPNLEIILEELNNTYGIIIKDKIKVTSSLSAMEDLGIYSSSSFKERGSVLKCTLISTDNNQTCVRNLYTTFETTYNNVNSYDMLTKFEQDILNLRVGGPVTREYEIEARYNSTIAQSIKDTFSDYPRQNISIINLTEIIRIYNLLNGIKNNFSYDETLVDIKRLKEQIVFTDFDNYLYYQKKEIEKLNEEKYLPTKEHISNKDYNNVINLLINNSIVKEIKLDKIQYNSNAFNIMVKFASRNESLLTQNLNLDNLVVGEETITNKELNEICNTYDLDGKKTKEKIEEYQEKHQEYLKVLNMFKKNRNQ